MPHPDTSIDRISPTQRPDRRPVMYQSWRSLLFLHWEVDPRELRPLVPAALDLDLHEGRALVGLVPFTMRSVRPAYLPAAPWLSYFHETNVRTYVHNHKRDPGVWFFSLEAANPVAVKLARKLFHLPYYWAEMTMRDEPGATIRYTSRRRGRVTPPATTNIRARPVGGVRHATPGGLEHFLLERYLLYCTHRGRIYSGQVHHAPYPVQTAEVLEVEETLLAAAGISRGSEPFCAHFSKGVDVEIFPLAQAITF